MNFIGLSVEVNHETMAVAGRSNVKPETNLVRKRVYHITKPDVYGIYVNDVENVTRIMSEGEILAQTIYESSGYGVSISPLMTKNYGTSPPQQRVIEK